MTHHKITIQEWQIFSNKISFSKQTVEQLSKLYIIIHEKVKSSIKNSVVNPHLNFSEQAQHHIQFIKNVLQKIKDTQNDQYLVQVQKELLVKYEKNLLVLLNQIEIMLKVEESKIGVNIVALKGFIPQKKQKHDLKSEVVESGKRKERAKSGYKSRKQASPQKPKPINENKNSEDLHTNSFFPTNIDSTQQNKKLSIISIQNQSQLQEALNQKRQALENRIRNSISKSSNGLGISFQKKYENNNLEMYFTERKQFADLMFNQQVYDQIIHNNESDSRSLNNNSSFGSSPYHQNDSTIKSVKLEEVNSKLFPQFQIKTKFLKPAVKSKISNLITDIKKQLMREYFEKNVETLKAVNESEKTAKFAQTKRTSIPSLKKRCQSLAHIEGRTKLGTIHQSQDIGQIGIKQKKNFSKTHYQSHTQLLSPQKINRSQSYQPNNTIHSKKQMFNMTKTRKSFINSSEKPFYQTQKWNQGIEKKYQRKFLSKLIGSKIG